MSKLLAIAGREMRGLGSQRWILVLLALLAMELALGVGTAVDSKLTFTLSNILTTICLFGSLAMMGLSLDAVAKERASGSLDLILTRPVDRATIILGKLLAYVVLAVPVAVVCILLPLGVVMLMGAKMNPDAYPLHLAFPASALYLAAFAVIGVAISIFCRTLQSAFAVGGALWAFVSPLMWQMLILRGLAHYGVDEKTLAVLNVFNPMGAFFSAVVPVSDFGASNTPMDLGAPTWLAFAVLAGYVVLATALSLHLFGRQEEVGAG